MSNQEIKLPRFRKYIKISFTTTTIHDEDYYVRLYAYRVKTKSGWKWFIGKGKRIFKWSEIQKSRIQGILDKIGSDLSKIKILYETAK